MSYVDEVIAKVKEKNASEPEFLQTVEEVLTSIRPLVDANEERMLGQFKDAPSLAGLERDTSEPEPPSAEVVELARTRIAAAIEERRAA